MASQIKILKKFLSLSYKSPLGIYFDIGNFSASIEMIGHSKLSLCRFRIRNKTGLSSFLNIRNSDKLQIFNDKPIMIDIDDFQNFDDISLVLKYGRVILDENIIQNWSKQYFITNISLSDFNDFLGL